MNPWIQTRDGHIVDLLEPDLSDLTIEEVAHALARLNRFTGHTKVAYSVAQHCVHASEQVDWARATGPERLVRLAALLHDAHESVIGDISSPVKLAIRQLGGGNALKRLDERMESAFWSRFGGGFVACANEVKQVDLRLLVTERRDLLGDFEAQPWEVDYEPFEDRISAWSIDIAEWKFLARYAELKG